MASYATGGQASGKSGSLLPGEDAMDCSVEMASVGNSNGPNTTDDAPPGGYGSSGSASSSSPAGMTKKGGY